MPKVKLSFTITGMHCTSCAANIQQAVRKLPGATEVYVNFAARLLTLQAETGTLTPERIIAAVQHCGFTATLQQGQPYAPGSSPDPDDGAAGKSPAWRRFLVAAAFSAGLSYVAMHPMLGLPFVPLSQTQSLLLQMSLLLPVLLAGREFYRTGIPALLRGVPNMDTLIAIGTVAAIIYSLRPHAAGPPARFALCWTCGPRPRGWCGTARRPWYR